MRLDQNKGAPLFFALLDDLTNTNNVKYELQS